MSISIWRHGNRTRVALDTYGTDPYKDVPDSEGAGNLNKRGKLRAYQLGQTLRERYDQFLGEDYLIQKHQVRSTAKRRATDSAFLVMAGLFPPRERQQWTSTGQENLGQLWQPFDIIIEPQHSDNLLGNTHIKCPAADRETMRIRTCNEVIEDERRLSDDYRVFEYITRNAGNVINDSYIAQGIHNALLCEEDQGWPIPEWTRAVYPEPLRSIAGVGLGQFARTRLMQRFVVGPLLEFMISSAEKAAQNASEPKLLAFSGHDNNIVALFGAFGLTAASNTIPKYSAHIAWEVRQSPITNDTYVRVIYEGEELNLPGCDFRPLCSLSSLRQTLSDVIVTRQEHWKECAL